MSVKQPSEELSALKFSNRSKEIRLVDIFVTHKTEVSEWLEIVSRAVENAKTQGRSAKFFEKVRDMFSAVLKIRWDSNGYVTIDHRGDLYTYEITKAWTITLSEIDEIVTELGDIVEQDGENDPQHGIKKSLFHLYRTIGGLIHFAQVRNQK